MQPENPRPVINHVLEFVVFSQLIYFRWKWSEI